MGNLKAILIDVYSETIKEVEVIKCNGNHLDSINEHIGCSYFTCVRIDNQNSIFVDDEGFLRLNQSSKFFIYDGYPQPLTGNGLIIGNNSQGDSIDTTLSIEEISKKITFLNLKQVQLFSQLQKN